MFEESAGCLLWREEEEETNHNLHLCETKRRVDISLICVCVPPPVFSTVGAPVLRGVVVPAGHGSGGPHPHPGGGLHAAAARTRQQVPGLWLRCVALETLFWQTTHVPLLNDTHADPLAANGLATPTRRCFTPMCSVFCDSENAESKPFQSVLQSVIYGRNSCCTALFRSDSLLERERDGKRSSDLDCSVVL